MVEKNYYLHRSAREAYRSYLLAYASHSHKHIFDVHALDLQKVSTSFGFTVPPKVDLSAYNSFSLFYIGNSIALGVSARGTKKNKKDKQAKKGGNRRFTADNPYGYRESEDKRQFAK